ncbi:MAG: hypothetical protein HC888_16695 [Candidatus Competibacteraceae bacterium]|nr:hypothetical protein [Candidatus Competibacteraceae bacterium]
MHDLNLKDKQALLGEIHISQQAHQTLAYFIDFQDAPNMSIAVELACWITRKVLATPHLADEVLKDLPTSPNGIPLQELKAHRRKLLRAKESQD